MSEKARYSPGELFVFELLLFGVAMKYASFFVLAFRELSDRGFGVGRGRCILRSVMVQAGSAEDAWTAIYSDTDQRIAPPRASTTADAVMMATDVAQVRGITLRFLTPTELKHDGRPVRKPEFHHVIKRLRDRVNAISCFFGGSPMELDFAEYGRRAEAVRRTDTSAIWVDRERLSTRTQQRHSIGGFIGEIHFEGDLSEFLPLLRLGEWTHVGKHAVWGNGQYRIGQVE